MKYGQRKNCKYNVMDLASMTASHIVWVRIPLFAQHMENDDIKKIIEEAAIKISNKIKLLNETRSGFCFVCEEETGNWAAIIPDDLGSDSSLGKCEEGKARIVFVPVCETHNLQNEEVIKKINKVFFLRLQQMKN